MDSLVTDDLTEKLLRQQKRELAILNAIIQTVSSSYNLKDTLESALQIILSVLGSDTGWICLIDDDRSCTAFVGKQGLCLSTADGERTPCLVQCVCSHVQKTRDVVIVRQLNKGCPLLVEPDAQRQNIVGHVSVPMMTRARLVGQLNVAFSEQQQADQMDVDLLKAIGPQLAVAVENARLWEDVQEKEALRKELLKRVVTVQEDERRRISRELHDELGQEINSLLVRLKVLQKIGDCPAGREIITGLEESASAMLGLIHDMALELRPTILDDLGLVPALAQYIRDCPEHLNLVVDFEVIGGESRRLPREIETTLYRIVQESLTNAARHAQTGRASVLLRLGKERVMAIIEDNGVGFDLNHVRTGPEKKTRLGLYGMQERVALVGGKLTIETSPGAGTHIYAEVPL